MISEKSAEIKEHLEQTPESPKYFRHPSYILPCGNHEGKFGKLTQGGFLVSGARLSSRGREGEAECEMTARGFLVCETRLVGVA